MDSDGQALGIASPMWPRSPTAGFQRKGLRKTFYIQAAIIWRPRKGDNRMSKEKVKAALESFDFRMTELQDVLSTEPLNASEKTRAKQLYSGLKLDIKSAAQYGTVDGIKRTRTDIEDAFYYPAICGALIHLKPATNSDPTAADWCGAIENAKCDIDTMLFQLGGGSD
ncbi:hypothetical protein [Pantoea sp. 18069]|uniref:hypothetical protein n=1 Tax=Pantoea sp. 18069 TaxID=2681415 RepID=UPI0013580CD7|nr:hypothetical protein [Pantoea sp. 18069]